MNTVDREQLRLSLLRFLDARAESSPKGLGEGLLHQMARAEGRTDLAQATVRTELQYLADKGLVDVSEKVLSPENRQWRITAQGRDAYAEISA